MSRSGATPLAATRPGGHHSIVQGDGYSATAMTETAKTVSHLRFQVGKAGFDGGEVLT
jgi:hypothetical protein